MAGSLEQRSDGSMALFIAGDLQFDSNDECIYHEALVLPAMAIALKRIQSDLRVLVVGGGDGLVAREILKSTRIASLDLVDYDPDILALAKNDLLKLNGSSLLDSRVTIHVKDAWDFAEDLLQLGASFDAIVCDLTVADSIEGARFHSIEWYGKLCRLLTANGVVSVNAVSPQATPKAYWSVFNGMVKAGLHPRSYHVEIPSFATLGYGQDWGFFIASSQPVTADEFNDQLQLVEPTKFLKNVGDIRKLFVLPEEVFAFQAEAAPALAGSDVLLRYFKNAGSLSETSGAMRDSFSLDSLNVATPEPDGGREILSPQLSAALAASIYSENGSDPVDTHSILQRVLELMPSLERDRTSQLISDFLQQPEVFLRAIDLPGLVSRLLQRASELPVSLVAELELLRDKLEDWAGDERTLLSLGRQLVTILSLTIIIGNVLYPDLAYAKDSHAGHASHSSHAASGHHDAHHTNTGHVTTGHVGGAVGGVRNVGVYGNRYWNGTRWLDHAPGGQLKNSLPQRNDLSQAPLPETTIIADSGQVGDVVATTNMLLAEKQQLTAHLTALSDELSAFQTSQEALVTFGSNRLPKEEAIRLTQLSCRKTQNQIESLDQKIASLIEQSTRTT